VIEPKRPGCEGVLDFEQVAHAGLECCVARRGAGKFAQVKKEKEEYVWQRSR